MYAQPRLPATTAPPGSLRHKYLLCRITACKELQIRHNLTIALASPLSPHISLHWHKHHAAPPLLFAPKHTLHLVNVVPPHQSARLPESATNPDPAIRSRQASYLSSTRPSALAGSIPFAVLEWWPRWCCRGGCGGAGQVACAGETLIRAAGVLDALVPDDEGGSIRSGSWETSMECRDSIPICSGR